MGEPESAEKRRAAVENRLKKARPRPVQFDAAALTEFVRAIPLHRTAPSRLGSRSAALIAASWACGAIVGATVMFLVIKAGPSAADSPTTAATRGRDETPAISDVPRPAPPGPAPVDNDRRWTELDEAVLALAVPGGMPASWPDGRSLWAGMCLPRLQQAPPDRAASSTGLLPERLEDGPPSGSRTERAAHVLPSPRITREQLMQDLLGESSGFVL